MSGAPSGWYPDPGNSEQIRLWDGTAGRWTAETKPRPALAAPRPETLIANPHHNEPVDVSGTAEDPWAPSNIIDTVRDVITDPDSFTDAEPKTTADILGAFKTAVTDDNVQNLGRKAIGTALIADGFLGFGKNRPGLPGSVLTMVIGAVWILICTLVFTPLLNPSTVAADEKVVQGVVTSVHVDEGANTGDGCGVIASFTHKNGEYQAHGEAADTCPWKTGVKVDVIVNPKDPAGTARVGIKPDPNFLTFVMPGAGVALIIVGGLTFLRRAGSIGAGLLLIFGPRRKRGSAADVG